MKSHSQLIEQSVATIMSACRGSFPKIAIVLGSGLGDFGNEMGLDVELAYSEIPVFKETTVSGHKGRLLVGKVGETAIACLQGRMHMYEGHHPTELALPIRALRRLGVEVLVLTNSCGSLRPDFPPGALMMLEDHINFSGFNPLIGPNDEDYGPRFVDMTNAWDEELRSELRAAAKEENVDLKSGVYIQYSGPNFETPAEIRMFQQFGDAIGMSTVPECLVANHCGMRVAGISVITNLGAGLADHELSHSHTVEVAGRAYGELSRVLIRFLGRIEVSNLNSITAAI